MTSADILESLVIDLSPDNSLKEIVRLRIENYANAVILESIKKESVWVPLTDHE